MRPTWMSVRLGVREAGRVRAAAVLKILRGY